MKLLRELLFPVIAVLVAFVVGGIIVWVIGDDPFEVYGLLLDFDLSENSILGLHYRPPAVSAGPLLDLSGIRARAQQLISDFDVRPANPDLPARALSGGNQQKLIIGREFGLRPKLLLVSQPTRGVDIGAIEFIHRKLVELRDEGCAILLVSAELEEVTSLADRLLVIYHGRIVGEVDPKRATQEEIGLLMTGGEKQESGVRSQESEGSA